MTLRDLGKDAGEGARVKLGLDVVHSPDPDVRGRWVPLTGEIVAGRRAGPDVGLVIGDPSMSRRHAALRPDPWRAVDLDSHNGTWVNGERVRESVLEEGDVLRLAETVCLVTRRPSRAPRPATGVVARSAVLSDLLETARELAALDVPVILLGETGTGKEVVARFLHQASGRTGPFVGVNCAAIPADLMESTLFGHRAGAFTGATKAARGLFLEARGGTLFLDEVGELPLTQQPKLLRVLETHELTPVGDSRPRATDARVVVASNSDLAAEVAAGHFRKDLYARLAASVLRLPPLRERREDILPLARHFAGNEAEWTSGFVESLLLYPWPLNVRGLRNAMARVCRGAGDATLTRSMLCEALEELGVTAPPPAKASAPPRRSNVPPESELRAVLSQAGGNVAEVARHYDKDSRQVYRWVRYLGIELDDYRP